MRPASRLAAGAFGVSLSVSGATLSGGAFKPPVLKYSASASIERSLATDLSVVSGAAISGFVCDSNGAVVPAALVTLLKLEGTVSQTTTGDDGQYRFEGLEAGDYSIRVHANGFADALITSILVNADSQNVINATLEVARTEVTMGVVATVSAPSVPLVKAAQSDDIEAVKQLLVGSPNVNIRDEQTDATALEHAVLNSNREMIQLLLLAGADVNAHDRHGRTPLMLLGDDMTSDAVWDLINAGAKVNVRDEDGDTALSEAAACSNLEILKVLLDAGADVNAKNNEGETALMRAAEEGHVNNVRALIMAGADVNVKDKEGNTAWMRALDNDHKAVLRLLKSYGVAEQVDPRKAQ